MATFKVKSSDGTIEYPCNSIVNQKDGSPLKIWYGTQAEYNALTSIDSGIIYLVDKSSSN